MVVSGVCTGATQTCFALRYIYNAQKLAVIGAVVLSRMLVAIRKTKKRRIPRWADVAECSCVQEVAHSQSLQHNIAACVSRIIDNIMHGVPVDMIQDIEYI